MSLTYPELEEFKAALNAAYEGYLNSGNDEVEKIFMKAFVDLCQKVVTISSERVMEANQAWLNETLAKWTDEHRAKRIAELTETPSNNNVDEESETSNQVDVLSHPFFNCWPISGASPNPENDIKGDEEELFDPSEFRISFSHRVPTPNWVFYSDEYMTEQGQEERR